LKPLYLTSFGFCVFAFLKVAQAAPTGKSIRDELTGEARVLFDAAKISANRSDSIPDLQAARSEFYRAYELSKNPRVLYNVSVMESLLGRYPEAVKVLRKELAEGQGRLTAKELAEIDKDIEAYLMKVGSLELSVDQAGASVQIDDDAVGVSPLEALPFSGERTITVKKAGFLTATRKVSVVGKQTVKVAIRLEPMVLTSEVEVSVSGAPSTTLLIDGIPRGAAPFRGKLAVQNEPHVFVAESPGFTSVTQTGVVVEGQKLVLSLALGRTQTMGTLVIEPQALDTLILIDDNTVGSRRWEGAVKVGPHRVTIRKEGYYSRVIENVVVTPGGRTSIAPTLDENKNTNWLAWAIGTTLIVGGASVASYVLFQADSAARVPGTLRSVEQQPVSTSGFRFR
jgi:PEGA domain